MAIRDRRYTILDINKYMKTTWNRWDSQREYIISNTIPQDHKITGVWWWCFVGDSMMLADQKDRWRDILGGHVEEGETAEETMKREAMEEWWLVLDTIICVWYLRVTNKNHPRYPDISYVWRYLCTSKKVDAKPTMLWTSEIHDTKLCSKEDINSLSPLSDDSRELILMGFEFKKQN